MLVCVGCASVSLLRLVMWLPSFSMSFTFFPRSQRCGSVWAEPWAWRSNRAWFRFLSKSRQLPWPPGSYQIYFEMVSAHPERVHNPCNCSAAWGDPWCPRAFPWLICGRSGLWPPNLCHPSQKGRSEKGRSTRPTGANWPDGSWKLPLLWNKSEECERSWLIWSMVLTSKTLLADLRSQGQQGDGPGGCYWRDFKYGN